MEELSENSDRIALNESLSCTNCIDFIAKYILGVIQMQISAQSYFRIFLTMVVLLIVCILLRMCIRVFDYEITPPNSPADPNLLVILPKEITSRKHKEETSKKRRYYLSPKRGCTCKLKFSSPLQS